ncbi:hypothetical protein Tco_1182266 [Tanacetum coccineum]
MSNLKFAETHNLFAFLKKPKESDGFEGIIDFLNASSIRYALTIQALVDGKKVIVTETSVRRALQLKDAEGTECLPNAIIFVELKRTGAKTTAWNKYSSTIALAIICLATNQQFNFSKYIFDNMRRKRLFLGDLSYPLFETMMVQAQEEGEGSEMPTVPQHTPTINQPSTSQPPKKQKPRKTKKLNTEDSDSHTLFEIKALAKPHQACYNCLLNNYNCLLQDPKDRGVVVLSKSQVSRGIQQQHHKPSQLPQAKDKGKGKMVEDEKPLKKKGKILVDEEIAQRLQEELKAELEEEEILAKQKEEEDNLILWDNTQAMIEADYELAQRLHAEEHGELTIEERSKLFVELIDKGRSTIMSEPLLLDRVFDFPMDEPESHPAYDFFAPGPLPGYTGNPNNNNGWIDVDVPLLGELGAEADEPMVGPVVDEIAEPIIEIEEQVIALVIDMEEDIAMLFGDDDFSDDDSEGFKDEEEVWEVNEEWLMAPVTPPPMPVVPPPSTYEVGGPSTSAAEGQSFTLPAPGFTITILKTNTSYPSRRYGVSVPALTKDYRRLKINTPYPEDSIRRIQDMESI